MDIRRVLFSWSGKDPELKVLDLLHSVSRTLFRCGLYMCSWPSLCSCGWGGKEEILHKIDQVRTLYYCFYKIKLNFSNLKWYLQYKLSIYIQPRSIQNN